MAESQSQQLEPCMQQLAESLLSVESWGDLANPLDRSVEILQGLHGLLRFSSDLKVSPETLDSNISRIFRYIILVIDHISQLYASSNENNARKTSRSLRCGLVAFLPELKTAEDLCSYAELCNVQLNLSNERELVLHLRAVTNVITGINELLDFFKCILSGFNKSSIFMWGFSEVLFRLDRTVSKLETTTVTAQKSEYVLVSTLFSTLDRPLKIAMNALRLLFTFPTIKNAEFDDIIALCKEAAKIFVCATAILYDLTSFILKSFPVFRELIDKLSQHIQTVHNCCSEIRALKTKDVTTPQSLSSTNETGFDASEAFPRYVPVSENSKIEIAQEPSKTAYHVESVRDTEAISVSTCHPIPQNVRSNVSLKISQVASMNVFHVPNPENVCNTEAISVSTSQESSQDSFCPPIPQNVHFNLSLKTSQAASKNVFHVPNPQSVRNTEAISVSTSQESSQNPFCPPIPENVHSNVGVKISQKASKNHAPIPQSVHSTEAIGVSTLQELTKNAFCHPTPQNVQETVGVHISQESSKNAFPVPIPQSVCDTKAVCTSQESSKKPYCYPIHQDVQDTEGSGTSPSQESLTNTSLVPQSVRDTIANVDTSHTSSKKVYYGPALPSMFDSDTDDVDSSVNTQSAQVPLNSFQDPAITKEIPAIVTCTQSGVNFNAGIESLAVCRTNLVPDLSLVSSPCPGISDSKFRSLTVKQRQFLKELVEKSKYHINFLSFSVKTSVMEIEALCKICHKTLSLESITDHINEQRHLRNLFDKCRTSSKDVVTPFTASFFVPVSEIKVDSVVPKQQKILQELIVNQKWHIQHFAFAVKVVEVENETENSESEYTEFPAVELESQTADSDLLVTCNICSQTFLAEQTEAHIQDLSHNCNIFESCKASSEAHAAVPDIKSENWQFLKIGSDAKYKCHLCSLSFGSSINAWVLHFHSLVHRVKFKEWRSQAEKSRDLAASANFFQESLETTFASLECSQKQRVQTLLDNLEGAMNFFSIEKKGKLSFFCHVCKESVASRKVPDHVKHQNHLRGIAHNGRRIIKRSTERKSDYHEDNVKPKKPLLPYVFNDSSSPDSSENSPRAARKRRRSSENRKRRDSSRERTPPFQEQSISSQKSSPNPKIRRGRESSSPRKKYVKNVDEERHKNSKQDKHESANLQGSHAKAAPYVKPRVNSPPSVQTATAATAATEITQNTAEMLVAKLQYLSSICAASLVNLKSKVSSPATVQKAAAAATPEVSSSDEENTQNIKNPAENVADNSAENSVSTLQGSSSTPTIVASSCSRCCEYGFFQTKNCTEQSTKCSTEPIAKDSTESSQPTVQKIAVITGMRKPQKQNIPQNLEQNTAENHFNLRSSANIRARMASYMKSRTSSQPTVKNVPLQKVSNSSQQDVAQNVVHYTEPNIAQNTVQRQNLMLNTVQKFPKNTARKLASNNRAKVAFALKQQTGSRPDVQCNAAKSLNCSEQEIKSLNCSEQEIARNTVQTILQEPLSRLQNTALKRAQNIAQNIAENIARKKLDEESFNRVFNSLLLEDKRTVTSIKRQIKDEINYFTLSHNPRTSELHMFCKLCSSSMPPEKVVGHISEPLHVNRVVELDGDFCEILQESESD